MADILIQIPNMGINIQVPVNQIDDRAAGDGTQNVDFDNGVVVAPSGISKLDCSSPLAAKNITGICYYTEVDSGLVDVVVSDTNDIYEHDPSNSSWDTITSSDVLGAVAGYPVSFASILHQDVINGDEYQHLVISDGGQSPILKWAGHGRVVSKLTGGEGYNQFTIPVKLQETPVDTTWSADGLVMTGIGSQWKTSGANLVQKGDFFIVTSGINVIQYISVVEAVTSDTSVTLSLSIGDNPSNVEYKFYSGGESVYHKALQVVAYYNRLLLISPYEFDGNVWIPNLSRVRWPQEANLQTTGDGYTSCWQGTGSGFVDLIDTGDINVRAEMLSGMLTIYQTHSIWQLRWVGGTTVFTPDPLLPSLGLLSYGLLVSTGSIHYFVGSDYNVYSYSGGTGLTDIGQPISDVLKRDLNSSKKYACKMITGPRHKFLWILFAPIGSSYATKAYKYNTNTGAWTVRDFTAKYTSGGITSVGLVGATVYTVGQSYSAAVTGGQTYAQAVIAGTTYADTLSQISADEQLLVGDSNGYVLKEDATVTTDDGVEPIHYYYTKEFDGELPDINKRIDCIKIDARGVIGTTGTITVQYSIDNKTWASLGSISLTADYVSYRFFVNRTGKKIQLRFSERFDIRSFGIFNVQPELER